MSFLLHHSISIRLSMIILNFTQNFRRHFILNSLSPSPYIHSYIFPQVFIQHFFCYKKPTIPLPYKQLILLFFHKNNQNTSQTLNTSEGQTLLFFHDNFGVWCSKQPASQTTTMPPSPHGTLIISARIYEREKKHEKNYKTLSIYPYNNHLYFLLYFFCWSDVSC